MKKLVSFKHFVIALAMTFAGLATFSACQDKNFDFDNMHAINYQEKFTNAFIEEFGQPAEGHQWGFDLPWMDKYLTRALSSGEVYKADGQDQSIPGIKTYGIVPSITPTEHKEVYEWFSTHQVTWITKTVNYNPKNGWKMLKDGNFVTQDHSNNVYGDCIVKTYPNSGDIVPDTKIEGDFMIVKGEANENGYITQRAGNNTREDGVSIAKAVNGGTPKTSSLYTYSSDKNGDTSVGITIDFDGAWIQHVAGDIDSKIPDYCKEKTTFGDYVYEDSKYSEEGSLKSVNMDQMNFYGQNGTDLHVYDFNACAGLGWNGQSILVDENDHWLTNTEYQAEIQKAYNENYASTHDINKAKAAANAKYEELWTQYGDKSSVKPIWYNNYSTSFLKNGVLILGADFNQTTYVSSKAEGNYFVQDKWIIVYLKGKNPDGTFYEGWYLGFDLEAAGESKDKLVEANGFCNNWIIKLTAVNTAVSTEPIRIMCEDLGGEANTVQIGDKVHISDIDYNDIVLDVTPDKIDNTKATLTLQAAGGTIPLTVWYDGKALFETHEMFQANKTFDDLDHKSGIDYTIMYNTQGEDRATTTDGKPARTYQLSHWGAFDINKLELKVWRLNTEQYQESSPNDFSDALWVNISNIAGEAPLKICVPQFVPWLKERCSINTGYPDFKQWVKDPSLFFWGTDKDLDNSKIQKQYLVISN